MEFLDEILERLQDKPKDNQITIFDVINEQLQLQGTTILLQERDKDIQHPCVKEGSKDRSGLQRSDNKERCDLLNQRIREKDMGTLRTFLQ